MAASAGHQLQVQSPLVEGRIRTLINNDLRSICRTYGQVVSGTKIQLQTRCITILRGIVQSGDVEAFNELSLRVSNHGQLPSNPQPPIPKPSYASVGTSLSTASMAPRAPQTQGSRLEFKNSPFYDRLDVVVRTMDLPEMPQNRHTVRTNLVLTDDQARRISSDPEQYRLMLYCALPLIGSYAPLDIAFPPQIEVKVNEDDVKANFKGLKGKPGTTKPADITKLIRPRAGYQNKLSICYALTTKRYSFMIMLVRYVSTPTLTQRIRTARVFPKAKVIQEYERKNADTEIVAVSSIMSLKDPISTARIAVPIRSTVCEHNQCFDASIYLQLQEQAPSWACPICTKVISFESLGIDKYFEEILQNTPSSVDKVTVEPSGEWAVIKDEQDKSSGNAARHAPRAAYDDDFDDDDDDDIVELDAAPKPAIKREPISAHMFSTPPASSREASVVQPLSQATKRTSTVIDLTLSDDDEPVRPAKRSRIDEPRPAQTQTPTSMHDVPFAAPRSHDPINRPATVAHTVHTQPAPFYPTGLGTLQTPIVLPSALTNLQTVSSLDRPSALTQRHSSSSSTPSLPSFLNTVRSPPPSLALASAIFARRWSSSKSPTAYGEADSPSMLAWPSVAPGLAARPPALPSMPYLGFAQDQTVSSPPLPNASNRPSAFGHPAAPPR